MIFEGIKADIAKKDTRQVQTKEKSQAIHIYTQRLIEIHTDTNTCKHRNKIIKQNKIYIKQIQYK